MTSFKIDNPSIKGYYYRLVTQEEMESDWPNQIQPLYFFENQTFIYESVYESVEIHERDIKIYNRPSIYAYQLFGNFVFKNDTIHCEGKILQPLRKDIESRFLLFLKGDTIFDSIEKVYFAFNGY